MPSTKKKDHLHVLRLKHGQTVRGTPFIEKIFQCEDPDCWFYSKAVNFIGKRAKCKNCLKDYVLTKEMLQQLKIPHCAECTKGDKAKLKVHNAQKMEHNVENFLEKFGIKI